MAVKPFELFKYLANHDIDFFTGVPDSLLKQFCLCIDDNLPDNRHVIAANEGNAIALAAGYHLATGKLPLVYMQNSGLGNAVNPLLSLCDPDVYSIPMLLLIGWRGEPGVNDEPQHIKQGKVQLDLLQAMDIPYEIISKDNIAIERKIAKSVGTAIKKKRPFAILVKKGSFDNYISFSFSINDNLMFREESLEIILNHLPSNSIIVSTTGKTSREIFEIREKRRESHRQDFLTVGSMGHCSSIALGIALAKPDRQVVCIDGDGAMLMHLGSLTTIASLKPKNFRHILLNNEVHESVGGQDTAAKNVDLSAFVAATGSSNIFNAKTPGKLSEKIKEFMMGIGPSFLEIKIQPGSRDDLGRPTIKPIDNKSDFMSFLEN